MANSKRRRLFSSGFAGLRTPQLLEDLIDPGKANTSSIHKIIGYVFIVPVLTGLLSIFYTIVFSGLSKDSDCIVVYLQGLDMGAGNWRLSHWYLPIDSFWFQDALAYALATSIVGNHPFLMVLLPAVAWAGVVVLAWMITQRGAEQRNQRWSILLVLALLAFPVIRDNPITEYLVYGGSHVFTLLQSLLLFLLAHRFLRQGGSFALALFLVLGTAAIAGDRMATFIAAIPIAGAALITGESTPRRRLIVAAVAVLIVITGHGLVAVNSATGGFTTVYKTATAFRFAPFADLSRNASFTLQGMFGFWGANFFGLPVIQALPQLMRLPLLALSVWIAVAVIWRMVGAALRLTPVTLGFLDCALAVGVVVVIVSCMFSNVMVVFWSGRYVLPGFAYSVILTARQTPRFKARAIIGTLALAGSLLAGTGYNFTMHPHLRLYPAGATELAYWLENQDLHFGYAAYWTAWPVTLASRGSVRVLSITDDNNGRTTPELWCTRGDWYPFPLDSRHPFFVIVDPPGAPGRPFKSTASESVFGPPSERTAVAGYTVNIYR
jgi:hypothetical protein